MKNLLCKGIMTAFTLVLFLVGISFGGDTYSVAVSVTIPAIPGVNAPPFLEQNSVKQEIKQTEQKQDTVKEEKKDTSPPMIQEETQKEKQLVKTFYSR